MEVKDSWLEKGYVDEPIPEGIDLNAEIRKMCKEKNAVILAHYYTDGAVQDIADFVGDSLALAQWSAKTDADIIVMCGVHFMGETNKILCPDKKVLVLDLNAGCSLADSCKAEDLKEFVDKHPGYKVVSYVNTTAAVKALTDVVVTSSNAKLVIDSFPQDEDYMYLLGLFNSWSRQEFGQLHQFCHGSRNAPVEWGLPCAWSVLFGENLSH